MPATSRTLVPLPEVESPFPRFGGDGNVPRPIVRGTTNTHDPAKLRIQSAVPPRAQPLPPAAPPSQEAGGRVRLALVVLAVFLSVSTVAIAAGLSM